jgi:hypothetical protein
MTEERRNRAERERAELSLLLDPSPLSPLS